MKKIHLVDQRHRTLEKCYSMGELDLALVQRDLENSQLRYTELIHAEIVQAWPIPIPSRFEQNITLGQFCNSPLSN